VIAAPRKKKKKRLNSHTLFMERIDLISFQAVLPVDSDSIPVPVVAGIFLFGENYIRSWNDTPTMTILITPMPNGNV
jgi:hypothetical protein